MAVILLADDELAVLNLISIVLRSAGHQVLTAGNGLEALAVFRSYQDWIDLIITDLKMPVMDGFELIGRIRETKPRAKIICMSAYSERVCPPGVTFLQKPFMPEVVRTCVKGALTLQHGERKDSGVLWKTRTPGQT